MNTEIDLRFGRYQDVLQDVECDVLICDPPYSERTHKGRRTGSDIRQSKIKYQFITEKDADELARFWSERCKWWAVIFCDHIARQWHAEAWETVGWYVFGPVRWIKPNAPPRMSGDGPCIATEDILIARRKTRLPTERTGSRPGYYINNTENNGDVNLYRNKAFPGGKPLTLMESIVRDYTITGDLICDPYAGMATTLIAAYTQNRSSVGAEKDRGSLNNALIRIESGHTKDMFVA